MTSVKGWWVGVAVLLWALWPLWHSLTQGTECWYNTSIQKFFCSKHCRTDADYFFAHSSITIRLADLKIIGTLQDFLQIHLLVYVIAFYCFLFKMFSQPLGHKYFSQIFCFWFHDRLPRWSFAASVTSIIFNLEPAPVLRFKTRLDLGKTSQLRFYITVVIILPD